MGKKTPMEKEENCVGRRIMHTNEDTQGKGREAVGVEDNG